MSRPVSRGSPVNRGAIRERGRRGTCLSGWRSPALEAAFAGLAVRLRALACASLSYRIEPAAGEDAGKICSSLGGRTADQQKAGCYSSRLFSASESES
jgi:hypothetical protein